MAESKQSKKRIKSESAIAHKIYNLDSHIWIIQSLSLLQNDDKLPRLAFASLAMTNLFA